MVAPASGVSAGGPTAAPSSAPVVTASSSGNNNQQQLRDDAGLQQQRQEQPHHHQHNHHQQQQQQQQQQQHANNEPDVGIGEWNRIEPAGSGPGGNGGFHHNNHHHHNSSTVAGRDNAGNPANNSNSNNNNSGSNNNPNAAAAQNQTNQNAEECDRFSFEDSDRFEEDSLCSWSSEPESVCNNWRGWKKPTAGMTITFGGSFSRRTPDGEPTSLTELAARCVASYIPFELCENLYPPVPEQMQLRIAFWSFPDNEEDIRLYSCLANSSADEFHRGELLFKNRAVKDPLQIGFHLSATVVQTQPRNQFNVAVTFDRRRISSCSCTCLPTAYWCSHVVAVCLYRIHCPTKVSLRAPVSESLSRLQREQLQKFAQYLISEQSQQILPIAQRLLDELLSAQPTKINTVFGAPDPTAGASVNDQTNWYLDEKTLHDNIKKILIKFCLPTPMVFSDVNYLTNSAPPAAAEWSSLLRPLRGREPEGMWNLLSIVREMYRRCDRNAIRLLEILTEEVMACDQILVWWFNIKLALLVGSNGHGGGGGGGGGGKHGNTHSNSNATQHACASLCDEIVVLWRLAALNPGLAPDERDMLHAQFTTWHLKILDRVAKNLVASSSHSSKQQQNLRNDAELFAGFKPAIEACYLDWEDYPIEGVTHTQDTNPMYHCPFTCFKQNSETRGDTAGPGQVNSSQAVLQNNVKQFQLMPHHHHHHSYHGDHHHHQQQQPHVLTIQGHHSNTVGVHGAIAPSSNSLSSGLGSATDRYRSVAAGPSGMLRSQQQVGMVGANSAVMSGPLGPNGMTKASSSNGTGDRSAVPARTLAETAARATADGGDYELASGAGSNRIAGIGTGADLGGKSHPHRRGRDRSAYGSSSNSYNSSSDSVPDRLNQIVPGAAIMGTPSAQQAGSTTSMLSAGTTNAGGPADCCKGKHETGEPNASARCDVVAPLPTGNSGGNRSSVSSEGFCENEDDLPVSVGEEKLHRVGAVTPATAIPGSGGTAAESAALLLSVSNSSSSSSSSSTSLSSSSAATDLLQKKKAAAEGAGSLSSVSSNENSILNDINNYEISGNIKLYEVLNMVEQSAAAAVAAAESHSALPSIATASASGKSNSAKRHGTGAGMPNATASHAKDSTGEEGDSSKGIADGVAGQQQQQQPAATGTNQSQSRSFKQHGSDSKQQQQVFSNIKPSEDAWDILFARAEGLHAHGHGREACTLGVRLAEEMLANPPNLMIDLPPPPKKKGKKHNINPISHQLSVLASATLSKCAFLCTVLAENSEHYHLAFRVCLFGLELSRPPASTKPLEVKLANQESDLLTLLKRIPLGNAELKIIRERAEHLRDGTLKSRGEALLPIMLASFIFDALVMPSVIGREHRMKVMTSSSRYPTDENLGFEAAVAALGLKANVSEAEHPLLCEGTRRQRGDLALTLLAYYKDEPRKICRIMEKLLDREIHVLIKTPLLPSYYSNNPPTRSQTSQLRMEEYEAAGNGGGNHHHHHHHQQHLQPFGGGAAGGGNGGGRSSSSAGSAELQPAAAGQVAAAHLAQGAEFCLANSSSSRPQSSTSADNIEQAIGAMTLGGAAATSANTGGATGSGSGNGAGGVTPATTLSTTGTPAGTTTTVGAGGSTGTSAGGAPTQAGATGATPSVTSTRSKDSRYKGKRAYPSIPNQPSEASAHFMFELAKNVLTKAGGTSSTSLFTQASTNTNHQGPHRGLHMCAFQLGLYALGLHNCVSPNWLSRTYSSHVSWIIGQAMDIGAPAISFLIDTWEGHLTPPEAAGMADRASSRGWDSNMVNPAAELALSVLPHAAALNPNEIQRAILQCKEQSDRMLERACITVENAAKGGGVYPEVLFQVSRYWYELYLRNTPGGEMEPEEQHDYFNVNLSLMDSGGADAVLSGANVGGPAQQGGLGAGGTAGVPGSASVGVGGTPQQPYPHQHQPITPIGLSPYAGYGFQNTLFHHQNMPYGHAANQMHQMYMATPPQFQYPPPPPPASHGGQQQQQQPPQPAPGYPQAAGQLNSAAAAAYQSMQPHGVPPQGYGTPPQYQGVPIQPTGGPPSNAGPMQQFYGNPQAAVAAAMQQQQQSGPVVGGPQMPTQIAQLPVAVAAAAAAVAAAAAQAAAQQQQAVPNGAAGPQGASPAQSGGGGQPNMPVGVVPGAINMRPQQPCPGGVPGGPSYAAYGPAPVAVGGAGVGAGGPPPPSVGSSSGSSNGGNGGSGGGPVRARHPHQFSPTQLRYLLATYNAGMLALETLARRVHDDRPQAKYARNPPYGEDVKWLLRISKKLGTQYLHQFCICVVNSIVSPFVLHEVAIESAHYLARNNPALVMQHLRSALTPLMNKCQSMYFQCIHQKLYHLTVPDYEDFTSTILSARNAFQITPEGNAQFKDWLQSIKRSKSCKKELWSQINAALNSK